MRKIIVVERYIGFSFAMFVGLSVCRFAYNLGILPTYPTFVCVVNFDLNKMGWIIAIYIKS